MTEQAHTTDTSALIGTSEPLSASSQIRELQYLEDDYKGWTQTNEDHLLLLDGLEHGHIQRTGGFLGVGEFQVIDTALQLGATAIVLGDLDQGAVRKNLEALRIVESAENVSEVLPKIMALIEQADGSEVAANLAQKLTPAGDLLGARVKLGWAQSETEFRRLKELIAQGRVAVAQIDITKPQTMAVVGAFFASNDTRLESAYLSNATSWRTLDDEGRAAHEGAVAALYAAGGYDETLLIRSGPTTDPSVVERAIAAQDLWHPDPLRIASHNTDERQAHVGDTVRLPETIERIYTGSYHFEFYTQDLGQYQAHVSAEN